MSEAPPSIKLGMQFGLLIEGWCLKDYLLNAVDKEDGYETGAIHGVQGSGKSSRALQLGGWIKKHTLSKKLGREPTEEELWESVLKTLVFTPSDFVRTLEEAPKEERLDLIIWDDIQLNYTSSTFKTDIKQYSAIDSTFAVIRTKVAIVLITIPNITRLPKNIKDNITIEVFIGKNRLEQIRRVFRLPGTRAIESNLFKPILEQPSHFDLYKVPRWAWDKYWAERLRLANEALEILKGVTDMEQLEGYLPVLDAAEICREKGIRLSPNTLQQAVSRGVIKGQKVAGTLCIFEKDLHRLMELSSHTQA